MKGNVLEQFPEVLPPRTNGDAIVRELRGKDTYPDLDKSLRGISLWFKRSGVPTSIAWSRCAWSLERAEVRPEPVQLLG